MPDMRRRTALLGLVLCVATLGATLGAPFAASIDVAMTASGLRAALLRASDAAIARLGLPGGFADDPILRIGLPGGLDRVRDGLVEAGLGPEIEDLEARMNGAAESVMPETRPLLQAAIQDLAIAAPAEVLKGGDDAATRLLESEAGADLAAGLRPLVSEALVETDARTAFDAFEAEYSRLPLMPSIAGTLTDHVVASSLASHFFCMGEQERAIRRDPTARTTQLLQEVFGPSRG